MKKNVIVLMTAFIGLTFSSCKNAATEDNKQEVKEEICTYSYDNSSSKVGFTAYKFLSKTGVGGAFNELTVTGGEANEDAQKVIESLGFEIPISSIDTKDAGRDAKISKFFFGTIKTDKITGKVIKLDASKGEATLSITMNGVSKEVTGKYTLAEADFSFEAEINVDNWNAQSGITALNNECKVLHTDVANGDKESKLWSDVTISFSTTLKKSCN